MEEKTRLWLLALYDDRWQNESLFILDTPMIEEAGCDPDYVNGAGLALFYGGEGWEVTALVETHTTGDVGDLPFIGMELRPI